MAGEVSYLSRFMVKFVEIVAAGFASAFSAYLLAQFGGAWLSSSPTAAPATAQVAPAAAPVPSAPSVQQAATPQQQPAPQQQAAAPVPAAAPQHAAENPAPLPAPKVHKPARAVAAREEGKPERKPDAEKSAEALARAALSKFDASRPPATESPTPRGRAAAAAIELRRSEPAVPVQSPAVTGSIPTPRPAEAAPALAAPMTIEPRPVAVGPAAGATAATPADAGAAQPAPAAKEEQGMLSRLVRLPDLLRPEPPPPPTGEVLRPPAPIGPTSRE